MPDRSPMRPRFLLPALLVLGATLGAAPDAGPPWLRVAYADLVDRDRLAHGAETVGTLLAKLGGRGRPAPGQRPADHLAYRLLDPMVEPYAFVLPDAIDATVPPADPPMVEIGSLFAAGTREPAWAEMLRARRYVVESDGRGRVRVFVAWEAGEAPGSDELVPTIDPKTVAREAFDAAWPVLRHVFAAERRRLARAAAGTMPALDVDVHAYRHRRAVSLFDVTARPWRVRVDETGPRGERPPLDVEGLARTLGRPARIEGGRLRPDGSVVWLFSDAARPPSILGRPLGIADAAVAYRAVFHGGLAEPYMSLDKGQTPWDASVTFGGRLRDTGLGLVSLLCDVRFKTFSLGVDPFLQRDMRPALRARHDGFRTHLERFAADKRSGAVGTQQTRFWFYPDDVDLTLSRQGDVLAIRRVLMTAASERVDEATRGVSGEADPDWTRDMVAFINGNHDALGATFPEIADLDETVRLMALFTWLRAARDRGVAIPDLDVLLDVELPAEPTPRRFPQLLTHNVLPGPGGAGDVDVLDQARIGTALDRLQPAGGRVLDPARRFRRALAGLDRRVPDQAALAAEMEKAVGAGGETMAALAYRAERLVMHQLVLGSIDEGRRTTIASRRAADASLRVFSVGIGGIDLGLGKALARAAGESTGSGEAAPASSSEPPASPRPATAERAAERDSGIEVPDHGFKGDEAERFFGGSRLRRGRVVQGPGQEWRWVEHVAGIDAPDVRVRRRISDPGGRRPTYERVEDGSFLRYRFEMSDAALGAVRVASPPIAPESWRDPAPPSSETGPSTLPPGLATLSIVPIAAVAGEVEPAKVGLRLATAGRELAADVPRGVLQRLVVGRDFDATPGRPLPALSPPDRVLGDASALMVFGDPASWRAPWEDALEARPGEEDPARIAPALAAWWAGESPAGARYPVVVGTDATRSPFRFAAATGATKPPVVLVPDGAFPGARSSWRDAVVAAAGGPGRVVTSLPGEIPNLVVLASAEAPGSLAERLRVLATDPRLAGKTLAVFSLASPVRPDVPARLLEGGTLAAIGLAEIGPVGHDAALERLRGFLATLASAPQGTRPERIDGPFVWFF